MYWAPYCVCSVELTSWDLRQLVEWWHCVQCFGIFLGGLSLSVTRFYFLFGSWDSTFEYTAQSDDWEDKQNAHEAAEVSLMAVLSGYIKQELLPLVFFSFRLLTFCLQTQWFVITLWNNVFTMKSVLRIYECDESNSLTARTNIEKMPMTCHRRSPQKTTVSEVTGSGFFGGSVGRSCWRTEK